MVSVLISTNRSHHKFRPRANNGNTSDSQLVQAAFGRFKKSVQESAFVPWKFNPRGADFEPTKGANATTIDTITVQQTASQPSNSTGTVDESYSLDLSTDGKVVIQAKTASGAMHGLTTLSQMFYKSASDGLYTNLAPVSIQDKPAFSHRGLNIDIARNYEPPENVKRLIDGMAFNKFNRLHIHATDSQSWPLEIPSVPELSAKGAYRPSMVWTAAKLQDVQSYAQARGIQAYIEIDSPGHTASIAYSHPDLITAFNAQPWSNDCAEPPCGQVKLNNPSVTSLFSGIMSDLLPRLSPYTSYFHTGGDELNANAYALDPDVGTNDSSVIQPYLSTFVTNLHAHVRAAGLKPIVWEEMIVNWNLTLPTNDTLVQTWIGQSSLDTVTSRGYKALFGEYNYWYLDCGFGQWIDPNTTTGSQTPIIPPYTDYCSPYKSWREIYAYDPTANLSSTQISMLEGGEVHMWGELTDPVNLDGKVWPRASAAAEVLWSGVKGVKGVDESVTRRLADVRERMVGLGFGASVVQMTWCLQNVGDCQL